MSWETHVNGHKLATHSTRTAAMNEVDRPWVAGAASVSKPATGETWQRRRGTWVKVAEGKRRGAP